jgi:energy-coupling factor transport system substrate-specific component
LSTTRRSAVNLRKFVQTSTEKHLLDSLSQNLYYEEKVRENLTKIIERLRHSIKQETSGVAIPFIAFGAALNLSVGQLVGLVKLPLYLDSIGTVLVAILCGPWAAMIAGSVANTASSVMFSPPSIFFIPTVAVIGAFTGFWARRGYFRNWYTVLLGGVIQGILAAIISAPISAYLFSGITLSGMDFLVMYFRAVGKTILESTFLQGLAADPVDKTVTYFIAYVVASRLPRRLILRFPRHENIIPSS